MTATARICCFSTGCAILFPVVVTFYVTWWFLETFDGIFSPLFRHFFGEDVCSHDVFAVLHSVVLQTMPPTCGCLNTLFYRPQPMLCELRKLGVMVEILKMYCFTVSHTICCSLLLCAALLYGTRYCGMPRSQQHV